MNSLSERIIAFGLQSKLPLAIFALALFAGFLSLQLTPREEEPQIVVPMVDVLITAPGISAQQVERQVTTPLEKLLAQIPGVEHIYSTTTSGRAQVTLRFYVGEDREDSLLNTYNKLYSNQQLVPSIVEQWTVKPVEVDDVAILMLALWSDDAEQYSDYELRRIADEFSTAIKSIPQTSEVTVVGGRPRRVQVLIDPESLAARQTSIVEVISALQVSNSLTSAGNWILGDSSVQLEVGDFIQSVDELNNLVVNMINGQAVYLKDVARIVDGPAPPTSYTWIDFTASHPHFSAVNSVTPQMTDHPMVTISIAKQRGSNAVTVSDSVQALVNELKSTLLPPQIHVEVLRDYGATADEKVNNLIQSLGFAVFTVVIFIGVFLGWRQAWVVGLTVPICYGITLALDLAFGYTINRVTLFALILALGLLVDDPITGVDNISRFLNDKNDKRDKNGKIVAAIYEIRTPLLMSTLTIILAFVPLAFITGMMGPYMAPMAFNVPVSVLTSTLVAFLVTPWLTKYFLKDPKPTDDDSSTPGLLSLYRRLLGPLLDNPRYAKITLWSVLVLFMGASALPLFRTVPLKLLPFDNKNEVQILVEMPANSTLEHTAATAKTISSRVAQLPEVKAIASFVGVASPIDFNGMVRSYNQREGNQFADLRVTLADKSVREHQSHAIVLRLRELLADLNVNFNSSTQNNNFKNNSSNSAIIKVVEVPPGPPVLSTLVAEVYGSPLTPYTEQQAGAAQLAARLEREAHVVEVETSAKIPQAIERFVIDKQKAAFSGVSNDDINQTVLAANHGVVAGYLQNKRETTPLPIELRLPEAERHSVADLLSIHVKGRPGVIKMSNETGIETAPQPLVALGEMGEFVSLPGDHTIFHKDLKPVVYVNAELSGRTPAEVVADVHADYVDADPITSTTPTSWQARNFIFAGAGDEWTLPAGVEVSWRGEGEWRITVDVFRDMGIAFAFALAAIFIVLQVQTGSVSLSLIIMSAIPLTMIGIMPGFWLLNQFGEREIAGAPDPILFTATAMIGMIALAGIVVRNSLILVEFITQARQAGMEMKEALIQAGAVRMRPVLLTAGTTLLGNLVITLDPVFSGLALAIIFGILASTVFTLVVVPVVYYLVFKNEPLLSTPSSQTSVQASL